MPRIAPKMAWPSLVAAVVVCLSFAKLTGPLAAGQGSHPGPVMGVIDGVAFEGDQYYVHGWACQEGNRGSIDVTISANRAMGGTSPETHVMSGPANLSNETAVDRE